MQETDDDSSLTQLANAWVYLFEGKDKYQEAAYIYQELADKSGTTTTLLNGMAVSQIRLERYDEAIKFLQKAIKAEGGLDSLAPTFITCDLLVNLMVCATHLRKRALVDDCIARLQTLSVPGHPYNNLFETLKAAKVDL